MEYVAASVYLYDSFAHLSYFYQPHDEVTWNASQSCLTCQMLTSRIFCSKKKQQSTITFCHSTAELLL